MVIEWQQVVQRMITSGTTSYKKWQRVTTSHNEWQWVTTNDNEWQWMTGSGTTNENEWEQSK